MVAATWIMVVAYISLSTVITNWRNKLREEMNELDTQTVAKSVEKWAQLIRDIHIIGKLAL